MALVAAMAVGLIYAGVQTEFNRAIPAGVTVRSACGAADLNNDGVVDGQDLQIVARNINTSPPGDPRADVINNNIVDIFDLAFVASCFSSVIDVAAWDSQFGPDDGHEAYAKIRSNDAGDSYGSGHGLGPYLRRITNRV